MTKQNNKALYILKIGSESFAKRVNGKIEVQTKFLHQLAQNISKLRQEGQEFAIVSSGAVQMGRKSFEKDDLDWTNISKQSLAAEGNVSLLATWQNIFDSYDIKIAQILLNSEVHNGNYIKHAKELIKMGRIVIFNENDVVATRNREIVIIAKDNDTFAGQIAKDLNAHHLGIFSSIDGYIQNHGTGNAKLLKQVSSKKLAELLEFENCNNSSKSEAGTGGIVTKLEGIQIHLSQEGQRRANIVDSGNQISVRNYFDNTHNGTIFTNYVK
jgi:glutamate 5-kinase